MHLDEVLGKNGCHAIFILNISLYKHTVHGIIGGHMNLDELMSSYMAEIT